MGIRMYTRPPQWLAPVTETNVGPIFKYDSTNAPKTTVHLCYSQQKQNTNQTTHSDLCRKRQISACLHITLAHLNAFWINYFRSLRGSLIWLTNTPTVVTSHINSKCLMVTNSYHELLSMVLNRTTCAQIPSGICLGQGSLSSIITAIETLPSGYTQSLPKSLWKEVPRPMWLASVKSDSKWMPIEES